MFVSCNRITSAECDHNDKKVECLLIWSDRPLTFSVMILSCFFVFLVIDQRFFGPLACLAFFCFLAHSLLDPGLPISCLSRDEWMGLLPRVESA